MKKVITGIELTQGEDNKLRVEAAKANLSKRVFAAKIVIDWLEENYTKTLRDIIRDINKTVITTVTDEKEREILSNAVLNFVDGCMDLVKADILTKSLKTQTGNKETIIKDLEKNIQIINNFCTLSSITPIPDESLRELAYLVVNEYKD